MRIPKHVQIEPINGVCTSRCIMCTIHDWTRRPHCMNDDDFQTIMNQFLPHSSEIQYLTLHGNGEALLDKGLTNKVKITKDMGFNGVGFATNCTLLNEKTSQSLLEAGLDTIICSIDGIKKETHEAIRVGTNYDVVVDNVINFLRIRDHLDGPTRVMIRFIRQKLNESEWADFFAFWTAKLNPNYGDEIAVFDVHNWGDALEKYQEKDPNIEKKLESFVCEDLFERMIISSTGDVLLCSADENGFVELGNVFQKNAIEIYNSEEFEGIRKLMLAGKILEVECCKKCTIPRSRMLKEQIRI